MEKNMHIIYTDFIMSLLPNSYIYCLTLLSVLAIFRELQTWLTYAVYMATYYT
jgi:hypothetical protein